MVVGVIEEMSSTSISDPMDTLDTSAQATKTTASARSHPGYVKALEKTVEVGHCCFVASHGMVPFVLSILM